MTIIYTFNNIFGTMPQKYFICLSETFQHIIFAIKNEVEHICITLSVLLFSKN